MTFRKRHHAQLVNRVRHWFAALQNQTPCIALA